MSSTSFLLENDPLWYQKAVIYQVNVRSFFDADNNGIGDFKGITAKLDYLQKLGVNALWLMPFYPSPLRDDGYDIADYLNVNPMYGELDDVKEFIEQAHARGLRVITELIINHTSDQHPWFQAARNAPKGSPERDFYVWSDDPSRYSDARIIFKDFEPSNWTWDETAGQFFWHRFFHHQPDLNFDNPAVHQAVFDTLDYWMDLGVDGFRLDAIPYLYEREGTTGENLPETHAFLKKLRAHLDSKYKNKMLLAEANQWPEDTRPYFGDGDECHMNYNFPIMPRMYMSIMQEDRFPLLDILSQTPAIPGGSQWAMFLRNHDELTLEMVTEEERQFMWRTYSPDPRGRINLGIRRRIFPLMNGDREQVRLLHCMLLSMPGTPVLYYGDEIGMGDNLELSDRFGVRTPMQWSADPNAGFSKADPNQLLLPVISDPRYAKEVVNVELQDQDPNSQLNWMRKILNLRAAHPVFGDGSIDFLEPANQKILAYVRANSNEKVLVVMNLSKTHQKFELDLGAFESLELNDLVTGANFGIAQAGGQSFNLPPHGFLWLQIGAVAKQVPKVRLAAWTDLFESAHGEQALLRALRELLSTADYANDRVQEVSIVDVVVVHREPHLRRILVDAIVAGRERETYVLLLGFNDFNEHAFMQVQTPEVDGGLFDLSLTEEIAEEIYQYAATPGKLPGLKGHMEVVGEVPTTSPIIRVFAKTGVEPQPAWEIGNYLHSRNSQVSFGTTAAINHVSTAGEVRTVAVIEAGDPEAVAFRDVFELDVMLPVSTLLPKVAAALAQLHHELAEFADTPPLNFTTHYQRSVYQGVRSALHRLQLSVKSSDDPVGESYLNLLPRLIKSLDGIKDDRIAAKRIRVHGNLNLDRIYVGQAGIKFLDFTGGSHRHLADRRILVSPLTDVAYLMADLHATMLQSAGVDRIEASNRLQLFVAEYLKAAHNLLPEGLDAAKTLLRGYRLQVHAERALQTFVDDQNVNWTDEVQTLLDLA